jgi:hypothetical protein
LESIRVQGESAAMYRNDLLAVVESDRSPQEVSNAAVVYVHAGGDLDTALLAQFKAIDKVRIQWGKYRQGRQGRHDRELGMADGIFDDMGRLGPAPPEQLQLLEPYLNSSDTTTRCAAAYAYAGLGGDRSRATRIMLGTPHNERVASFSHDWLSLLSRSGFVDPGAVMAQLESNTPAEAVESIQLIRMCDERASVSLPKLKELANADDAQVAAAAQEATRYIEWTVQHPDEARELRRRVPR